MGVDSSETGSPLCSSVPKSGLPQSRPLNKQRGGRAGLMLAGRTVTPVPGKKKTERKKSSLREEEKQAKDRERERVLFQAVT